MKENLIKWALRASAVATMVYCFAIQIDGVEIIQSHPLRAFAVGVVMVLLTTLCIINEIANNQQKD